MNCGLRIGVANEFTFDEGRVAEDPGARLQSGITQVRLLSRPPKNF